MLLDDLDLARGGKKLTQLDSLKRYQYQMSEVAVGMLLAAAGVWPDGPVGDTSRSVELVWEALGNQMGFDPSTVIPTSGEGCRFFTAIPIETAEQRREREMAEYKKGRLERISKTKQEVEALLTEIRILEENK